MASNELIVDDEYCKAMGKYFVNQGEQLEKQINDYILILQDVKSKAIISGEVSDALSAYIEYVKRLNKKISNISTSTKSDIDNFLARIDSEDKYLF